jgi:hypothetical protein
MPRGPRGPNLVQWSGLPAFAAELKALPQDVVDAATPIVATWGTKTAAQISLGYPVVTGVLAARVRSTLEHGATFGVRAKVVSAAPHAHLYERGSYKTGERFTGKRARFRASRGVMPAAPAARAFIPQMQAARRELYPVLARLLASFGFRVTGDLSG